MTAISSNNMLTSLQKSLLIFFVLYWLIFIPAVWFVVEPSANMQSISYIAFNALLFCAIYIAFNCLIYLYFKECEDFKRVEQLKRRVAAASRIVDAVMYARNNAMANEPDAECQEHLNRLKGNLLHIISNDYRNSGDNKTINDNKLTVDYVICEGYGEEC